MTTSQNLNLFFSFSFIDDRIKQFNNSYAYLSQSNRARIKRAEFIAEHDETQIKALTLINNNFLKCKQFIDENDREKKALLGYAYDLRIKSISPTTDEQSTIYLCNNDLNIYFLMDKNQRIEKNNLILFITQLYRRNDGTIKPNEFKRFIRYGKPSDNIQSRISKYMTNEILKIGHKKKYASLGSKRRERQYIEVEIQNEPSQRVKQRARAKADKYRAKAEQMPSRTEPEPQSHREPFNSDLRQLLEPSTKNKQRIRVSKFALNLTRESINREVALKRNAERQIFAYSKITNEPRAEPSQRAEPRTEPSHKAQSQSSFKVINIKPSRAEQMPSRAEPEHTQKPY